MLRRGCAIGVSGWKVLLQGLTQLAKLNGFDWSLARTKHTLDHLAQISRRERVLEMDIR